MRANPAIQIPAQVNSNVIFASPLIYSYLFDHPTVRNWQICPPQDRTLLPNHGELDSNFGTQVSSYMYLT